MGAEPTRAERGRIKKRERIVAAAVKVFAAKGFYCARVSDVAREAGVADGTIYLYFDSKDELLRGLFEGSMRRLITQFRRLVQERNTAAEKLEALFRAHAQFTMSEPELAEVLTVELRESGKFMNEFAAPLFGEFLGVIIEIIEEGQANGEFRGGFAARNIARALFGALDELGLAWVMSTRKWDLEKSGQEVLSVFLGGVFSPEGHRRHHIELE